MIITIEGAPGVGKSTLAGELGKLGALVIPEVNLLFARPEGEAASWYYDRQNARWEMAVLAQKRGQMAVLDGDPFQPLWFNWIYGEDWERVVEFYRCRIGKGRIGVPDRYVFLEVDEDVRKERMMARELATGRGTERAITKTERYARMVEPQKAYFKALGEKWPGWVRVFDTKTVVELELDGVVAMPTAREFIEFASEWIGRHS